MTIAGVMLFAFVFGAIPFGFIIGKLVKNIDIRNYGSGNIGATNVLRILGPVWGSVSFLLDVSKGFVPVFLASRAGLSPWLVILAGAVAVLSHSFSFFLKFRGGKGVATSLGVIFGYNYIIALLGLAIFVLVLIICRYVSVGSCIATFGVFVMTLLWQSPPMPLAYKLVVGLLFVAIVLKHIPNFRRLKNGTENKFGKRAEINTEDNT
ncbi:MAG: glycerol-3-phosphate 1-O-acyltransferase PlsY [Abditibacteriota bacterium]|nr:glycerol-3-phosphate 1-O-acyltransferase PlsY [Abditibacteriota bacterium]